MYNTILFPVRQSDRLICVWVPTGDPKMPLTCAWIEDKPLQVDCIKRMGAALSDAPLHVPPSRT